MEQESNVEVIDGDKKLLKLIRRAENGKVEGEEIVSKNAEMDEKMRVDLNERIEKIKRKTKWEEIQKLESKRKLKEIANVKQIKLDRIQIRHEKTRLPIERMKSKPMNINRWKEFEIGEYKNKNQSPIRRGMYEMLRESCMKKVKVEVKEENLETGNDERERKLGLVTNENSEEINWSGLAKASELEGKMYRIISDILDTRIPTKLDLKIKRKQSEGHLINDNIEKERRKVVDKLSYAVYEEIMFRQISEVLALNITKRKHLDEAGIRENNNSSAQKSHCCSFENLSCSGKISKTEPPVTLSEMWLDVRRKRKSSWPTFFETRKKFFANDSSKLSEKSCRSYEEIKCKPTEEVLSQENIVRGFDELQDSKAADSDAFMEVINLTPNCTKQLFTGVKKKDSLTESTIEMKPFIVRENKKSPSITEVRKSKCMRHLELIVGKRKQIKMHKHEDYEPARHIENVFPNKNHQIPKVSKRMSTFCDKIFKQLLPKDSKTKRLTSRQEEYNNAIPVVAVLPRFPVGKIDRNSDKLLRNCEKTSEIRSENGCRKNSDKLKPINKENYYGWIMRVIRSTWSHFARRKKIVPVNEFSTDNECVWKSKPRVETTAPPQEYNISVSVVSLSECHKISNSSNVNKNLGCKFE